MAEQSNDEATKEKVGVANPRTRKAAQITLKPLSFVSSLYSRFDEAGGAAATCRRNRKGVVTVIESTLKLVSVQNRERERSFDKESTFMWSAYVDSANRAACV